MNKLERELWVLASCQVLLKSLHRLRRRSLKIKQSSDDGQNRVITICSLSLRLGFAISFKSVAPIVPKQAETKWNGEINPQNLNVEKNLMLSKRYKSTEVERRTCIHLSSRTSWFTSNGTHNSE